MIRNAVVSRDIQLSGAFWFDGRESCTSFRFRLPNNIVHECTNIDNDMLLLEAVSKQNLKIYLFKLTEYSTCILLPRLKTDLPLINYIFKQTVWTRVSQPFGLQVPVKENFKVTDQSKIF